MVMQPRLRGIQEKVERNPTIQNPRTRILQQRASGNKEKSASPNHPADRECF
jgi:hypothetical protein